MLHPPSVEELRRRVEAAEPFPHFVIDDFLEPGFARQVHDSFPSYEQALRMGRSFRTVNERGKVQVTDSSHFAPPLRELTRRLAEPGWLAMLSEAFALPPLLADPELRGGGMHQTGPRGRLDVHVDFNYIAERQWHRRLNVLIYLNPEWPAEWGGNLELWDREVKRCYHSLAPRFNRCVVFETSNISFHGVDSVRCPADRSRKSFAGYYYTREAPPHWTGEAHDTVFRSRPNEWLRGQVLMPAERWAQRFRQRLHDIRYGIRP